MVTSPQLCLVDIFLLRLVEQACWYTSLPSLPKHHLHVHARKGGSKLTLISVVRKGGSKLTLISVVRKVGSKLTLISVVRKGGSKLTLISVVRKGGSKLTLISVEESCYHPKKSHPICVYIAIRPLLEFSPPVFNFVIVEARLLCVEHWGTVWFEGTVSGKRFR